MARTLGPLASAAEYDEMLADLVASGVISDEKMAYFDVRPSSKESTVELRICDSCPIVNDGVLIAGLFRAMVRAAEQDIEAGVRFQPRPIPIYRASMWQAARGGLSGKLLDSSPHAKPKDAATVIRAMVDRLRPQLEEAGDWDEIVELLETVLTRGNSADRQRTALADHGDLNDVMRSVIDETRSPAAGPEPESPPIPGYRVRAGDEAILRTGEPKPAYRPILNWLREQNADFIRGRFEARDKWVREHGLTFSGGSDDAFDIDLVPRVIQGHDWEELSQGLTQRARALELFIRDMYGEQRAVKDGILPDEFVQDIAGWRAEASRIPAGSVRAGIQGFDLVRNEFGGWRILEDNLRCPSGMAYGTSAREMLNEIMPDMPRLEGLIDPRNAFKQLRETLLSGLGLDGTAVLLTNGPENSAWFEHKTLADGAGLLLVQANDLNRSGDRIVHGETGRNIDAIYLRLDDPLIDASKKDGQSIGADILDIAAAGKVRIINPPGNGVGDDKAVYAFVPELIRYYLNESPLLEQVPTYRTQDPDERRIVLERVGQLVTKPVDGFGGAGVLVGPSASAAELAERRSAIPEHPDAWVAQEVVSLSSHPTFDDAKLAPRHLDLRVFVFLTGTEPGDARLADVALTRVAPPGSLVVNSSRGGGGKDTWIIAQNAGGRLQGNGKVH
ncbi:putative glutamate--cysteine gcs2 protein [Phaeoacremonium minimum UCRPA7]|uniref:Putative glutamate--cysteine gcs2 protein n=1 Tax=Phaeoacremonium minimum (strain UCR-PA7) TaxID=1286976 RepID=R8BNZ8_PHAM7|nr:putative glutamate--cysteine gcs2 protein [Phaeoacremonium minimum UCRPA7]EOO01059.1 putative glutamate--cysteine gcs2 protein [Phaeoacremonium minimum UCRPA7]